MDRLTSFIEARHDYEVFTMKRAGSQSNWKIFGNINEITHLAVPVLILSIFMGAAYLWLLPVLWIEWWLIHDFACGYYLGKGIFYLGSGPWGTFMKGTFGGGVILAIIKFGLIVVFSLFYFGI